MRIKTSCANDPVHLYMLVLEVKNILAHAIVKAVFCGGANGRIFAIAPSDPKFMWLPAWKGITFHCRLSVEEF
jgi:hypothetical protein